MGVLESDFLQIRALIRSLCASFSSSENWINNSSPLVVLARTIVLARMWNNQNSYKLLALSPKAEHSTLYNPEFHFYVYTK